MINDVKTTLGNAHEALRLARGTAFTVNQNLVEARRELINLENQLRADGKIEGKNEADRKAHLAQLASDEISAVNDWEAKAAKAAHEVSVAELDWQFARYLVQLVTSSRE